MYSIEYINPIFGLMLLFSYCVTRNMGYLLLMKPGARLMGIKMFECS